MVNPLDDYTLEIKPHNRDIPRWETGALWPSGYYFGDGSGGRYAQYPSLTRCGVGVHYVDLDKKPTYKMSTPLPGEVQSNNRAEIYAILIAVQNIELAGIIDFFTDNKIARDTYNKGKDRARLANHADLWSGIFQHIENKYIDLRVYWIPSHTDKHREKKEKAPSWMQEWHVRGNDEADTLAGAAAALHEIPSRIAQPIVKTCTDLRLIQNRLIMVTKMFPQRAHTKTILKHVVYKPTYQDKILELISSSKHDCILHNNRVHCYQCSTSIHIKAPNIRDFLESSCLPIQYTYSHAVGNQHTHHTHRVVVYGGIYMCTKCGATGSRKLVKLARECKRPTAAGKINRDAYADGRPLPKYDGWPYKRIHLDDNIIINNIQMQIDRIQKAYEQQYANPDTESEDSAWECEEIIEDTNMGGPVPSLIR